MNYNMYWITTIIFIVILSIILINDFHQNKNPTKLEKSFRLLVMWVIYFCAQDCMWGLCESQIFKSNKLFFVVSSIFHISTVVTTFFWFNYILVFLGDKIQRRKLYLSIDALIIVSETILIIINCFHPILFTIQDGRYVTEKYRPLTFINQYIIYVITGIVTLAFTFRARKGDWKQYFSVFIFCIAPILLGIFQLLYPDAPFYSIGCFLGCFIIHIFIVSNEREAASRNKILHSLADIYYTMHILDLEKDTGERIVEGPIITNLLNNVEKPQEMLNVALGGTICSEYLEMVMEFTNLSTLSQRMKNKNHISCEVVGKNFGWTRITFIVVERNEDLITKVLVTTQIVDEEKRNQIELIFKSNHDELTGLYNRHAYEERLQNLAASCLLDDFVCVSMDLNELKNTNDSLGHVAGDELIVGAADCMKKVFSSYGEIYRTGGDEFIAFITVPKNQLAKVKTKFQQVISNWKGEQVDFISVSCGYVSKKEVKSGLIRDITILADERMYTAKNEYYRSKGIDRRGQRDAHTALCGLYVKILKINITEDTYQIVNVDSAETCKEKGFEDKISTWLSEFAKSGQIHPDDVDNYLGKLNLAYMRAHFKDGNKILSVKYRRIINGEFNHVLLDIIPANDYSDDNQNLFLYVKSIEN